MYLSYISPGGGGGLNPVSAHLGGAFDCSDGPRRPLNRCQRRARGQTLSKT